MRTIVVMHSGAGKTTYLRNSGSRNVFEVDDARTLSLELQLKPLRRAGDWAKHNAIWYPAIARWAKLLPADATVLVHHQENAIHASGGYPYSVKRWHPSDSEFARNLRTILDPERRRLATQNRADLLADPSYLNLPVWEPERV